MRQVTIIAFVALASGLLARAASATPFEPATIPDQVQAVGHLDVDALRKTQLFAAAGGQAAIDAAIGNAPAEMRPLANTVARTARGISFWRGSEHGAVYVETRDGRSLAQLVAKLPVKPIQAIDGCAAYEFSHDGSSHYAAVYGDTLVLADASDSLAQSIHALGGKAPNLAGSTRLPVASRQGLFVFVTIGDDLLGAIQKSAHSKMLQLALRSVVIDVGEAAGVVTANAHAEMRSADAVQKAKSILDGLHALASLSDDPHARMLLDGVTVTTNGLAVEVVAKVPVNEVATVIHNHHDHHDHHHDKK